MSIVEFSRSSLSTPLVMFEHGVENILHSRRHDKLIHSAWRIVPIGVRRIIVEHTFRGIEKEMGLEPDDLTNKLLGITYSTNPKDLPDLRREIGQYRLANRFCD